MKPTRTLSVFITALFFCTILSFAQENPAPQYITATTMHWNMDKENFSMSDWKAAEKMYMDKVIKKNPYITAASFYMHRYTASNTELVYVQAYNSWADIENAQKKNEELINEAWPDEAERNRFFKDKDSYYKAYHSDEIYATLPGAKLLTESPTEDMILYVRKSHLAFPDDGSNEEFMKYHMMWVENVIAKNEKIKAYYPHVHAWGSDKREFVEAYLISSMEDLENMNQRNNELTEAAWSEEELKDMDSKAGKYFTGK